MEVQFLDNIFKQNGGSAYTVGRVNGDHWLLYMSNPDPDFEGHSTAFISRSSSCTEISSLTSSIDGHLSVTDTRLDISADSDARLVVPGTESLSIPAFPPTQQDYTIEILMTHLSARARAAFITPESVCCGETETIASNEDETPSSYAQKLSENLGIDKIFPRSNTTLDAYSFTPCGYSSNALIKWGDALDSNGGEGYYTIHVTPEEGWSYASFECNVPLSTARHKKHQNAEDGDSNPDLHTLIQRVVRIFEPGKITLTLFVSSDETAGSSDGDGAHSDGEEGHAECAVDAAQRVFKAALTRAVKSAKTQSAVDSSASDGGCEGIDRRAYKRTDKINYEFGGYELAYASFELM
jgi:S-adenosylmethionine decarboxylase